MSKSLVSTLITNKDLVQAVQNLEPVLLKKIIHHVGLEDSAEILMLITAEQLQEVMDLDTWSSSRPGKDETLNSKRFCTWLEMLLEVSPTFAADKVAEMDEELLMLALSDLVMAIDEEQLELMTRSAENDYQSSNHHLDKILESTFSQEFEGYEVLCKETFQWDTVVNLFSALQKEHSDLLANILKRLNQITLDAIDEHDGLYNLLSEADMLENDVRHDREQRREKEGFVSPSNATAFLKLIHVTPLEELITNQEADPISKMYFRNFKPSKVQKSASPASGSPAIYNLLKSYGILEKPAIRIMLQAPEGTTTGIRVHLMELQKTNETLFQQRISEMNFLANALISGYGPKGKRLRPVEAADFVVEVCDQALSYLHKQNQLVSPDNVLRLFKIGWKLRTP